MLQLTLAGVATKVLPGALARFQRRSLGQTPFDRADLSQINVTTVTTEFTQV